uniref:Uncharacterized protein n=1 Tax=Candidatus Kentrum sp. LPFa TaxID=2126335 RepID=A0A450WFP4_9GAMM|nr:MAG: hypothetical protein BECKLPF1236A_GA0070988_101351 [Candidatus Kentron sp. LPFa]VFK31238.1 MAG: hypothetical protein BECKLPF1236C_GA0070990_101321 [Candidatus Kentron sp. LPFa]
MDKDDYVFVIDVFYALDQLMKSALFTKALEEEIGNSPTTFRFPELTYTKLYASESKDIFGKIKDEWKSSRKSMSSEAKPRTHEP